MSTKEILQGLGTRFNRDRSGKTSVHHGELLVACIRSAENPGRGGHRHGEGPISISELVAWNRRNNL